MKIEEQNKFNKLHIITNIKSYFFEEAQNKSKINKISSKLTALIIGIPMITEITMLSVMNESIKPFVLPVTFTIAAILGLIAIYIVKKYQKIFSNTNQLEIICVELSEKDTQKDILSYLNVVSAQDNRTLSLYKTLVNNLSSENYKNAVLNLKDLLNMLEIINQQKQHLINEDNKHEEYLMNLGINVPRELEKEMNSSRNIRKIL